MKLSLKAGFTLDRVNLFSCLPCYSVQFAREKVNVCRLASLLKHCICSYSRERADQAWWCSFFIESNFSSLAMTSTPKGTSFLIQASSSTSLRSPFLPPRGILLWPRVVASLKLRLLSPNRGCSWTPSAYTPSMADADWGHSFYIEWFRPFSYLRAGKSLDTTCRRVRNAL